MANYKEANLFPNLGKFEFLKNKKNRKNLELSMRRLGKVRSILFISGAIAVLMTLSIVIFYLMENSKEPEILEVLAPEKDFSDEKSTDIASYIFVVDPSNPISIDNEFDIVDCQGIKVNSIIAEPLNNMITAAKKDGINLHLNYGYVSSSEQAVLHQKQIDTLVKDKHYTKIMAEARASEFVEDAGESENQTGFCVTLMADIQKFEDSNEYLWLVKNMANYGFVFRYPKDLPVSVKKENASLILRYVDTQNALTMRQLNLSYDEYVKYLN